LILLDTHALVFDALEPKRLSLRARASIKEGGDARLRRMKGIEVVW